MGDLKTLFKAPYNLLNYCWISPSSLEFNIPRTEETEQHCIIGSMNLSPWERFTRIGPQLFSMIFGGLPLQI